MSPEWDSQQSGISEKEKEELDNYFQKKYFQNKDYFKLKVDETNPWNLTRKLYNQTEDKKDKIKDDYVEFHPHTSESYFVHKDEIKYYERYPLFLQVLYDYKYLIVSGVFLAFLYGFGDLFMKGNSEKKISEKKIIPQAK